MKDYTERAEIIRGSRWPPGAGFVTVRLHCSEGWAGADEWTWELLLSRTLRAGTPDVVLEADSAAEDGEDATWFIVQFHATHTQTSALPETKNRTFHVDIQSTDGEGVPSLWDVVEGTALVRSPAGEG